MRVAVRHAPRFPHCTTTVSYSRQFVPHHVPGTLNVFDAMGNRVAQACILFVGNRFGPHGALQGPLRSIRMCLAREGREHQQVHAHDSLKLEDSSYAAPVRWILRAKGPRRALERHCDGAPLPGSRLARGAPAAQTLRPSVWLLNCLCMTHKSWLHSASEMSP